MKFFVCLFSALSVFIANPVFAQYYGGGRIGEGYNQAIKDKISGVGEKIHDAEEAIKDAPGDAMDAGNGFFTDKLDIKPTDKMTRAHIAEDFSESIAKMQGMAKAAGGAAGLSGKSIEHIEELEKRIDNEQKLRELSKASSPQKDPDALHDILGLTAVSTDLKRLVEEQGDDAKGDLQRIAALVSDLPVPLAPYDQEETEQKIQDADSRSESVTLPTGTVVSIWQIAVEEHFAKAISENSAEEFQKGLNLIDVSLWQLQSKSNGFVYHVNIPGPECYDQNWRLAPGAGVAFAECDWHNGKPINALIDLLSVVGPLKDTVKGGLQKAGKNLVRNDVVRVVVPNKKRPKHEPKEQQEGAEAIDEVGGDLPPSVDVYLPTPVMTPVPVAVPPAHYEDSKWPESQGQSEE